MLRVNTALDRARRRKGGFMGASLVVGATSPRQPLLKLLRGRHHIEACSRGAGRAVSRTWICLATSSRHHRPTSAQQSVHVLVVSRCVGRRRVRRARGSRVARSRAPTNARPLHTANCESSLARSSSILGMYRAFYCRHCTV